MVVSSLSVLTTFPVHLVPPSSWDERTNCLKKLQWDSYHAKLLNKPRFPLLKDSNDYTVFVQLRFGTLWKWQLRDEGLQKIKLMLKFSNFIFLVTPLCNIIAVWLHNIKFKSIWLAVWRKFNVLFPQNTDYITIIYVDSLRNRRLCPNTELHCLFSA